jgi:hypothetical protein
MISFNRCGTLGSGDNRRRSIFQVAGAFGEPPCCALVAATSYFSALGSLRAVSATAECRILRPYRDDGRRQFAGFISGERAGSRSAPTIGKGYFASKPTVAQLHPPEG